MLWVKRTAQCWVAGRFQPASLPTESPSHMARTVAGGTAMHPQSISSLRSRCRHSRWWISHCRWEPMSTFLRSLRSRSITTLHRYCGRSDSCPALSPTEQVSLIHARSLPTPLPPTTHASPWSFSHATPQLHGPPVAGSGLHHLLAGSPTAQAESSFLAYRWVVHLRLLPTPSCDDAVTIGYRPESVCLRRPFTPLTTRALRRTSAGF